ncbi:MAG TPA: type II secretion system F family protein [Gemmatimonas sp.]|nr:type II secretion system F family protein [Gemmatimonas sp.]
MIPVGASTGPSPLASAESIDRWRYVASDAAGAAVAGEVDAASERDAVDVLRRRGLWATEVTRVVTASRPPLQAPDTASAHSGARNSASTRAFSERSSVKQVIGMLTGRTTRAELAVVVRAMSTLLAAGVPLDRALAYAGGPSSSVELQDTFSRIRERTRGGEALSAAVRSEPLLPAVFAPAIAAGEESGTLSGSLSSLADHLERGEALRAKLRAALVYPAVLGVASVLGMVVILLVVVPRFAELIADSGGTLPTSTRALIVINGVMTRGWWILLAAGALFVVAARGWIAATGNRARLHAARLQWPVVGHFERTRAAAGYTGVLALALRAGVPLLPAMRLARGMVGNQALAAGLAAAEDRVSGGGSIAGALETILPPLAVRLLDAGEASGDLAGMAARAAETAEDELQRASAGAVALIEPALILGFGGIVGFVALALLQAIYGLNARVL